MKTKPATPSDAAELRRQAEAKLSERKRKAEAPSAMETDTRRLVHELEVHQIELEMQNEELVQSRGRVEDGLRQYTDLYDFAPVGYFTMEHDGAILQVNLAGSKLLAVERSALINRRFGVFVSVESRPVFNALMDKTFGGAQKENCEVALQNDGSAPLWVHIEAIRENGQSGACRVVVSDLTERKAIEEQLSASEVQYRRLFESAKDGVLILESEAGTIVDVNPFLIELLGFSYGQFLGKKIWELGFFKDIVANQKHFMELKVKKYIRYEDLPLETADGRKINVEFVSNVYEVNHHEVIQCNIRDITERKRAAEVLQEATKEREKLVQELQHALDNVKTLQGLIPICSNCKKIRDDEGFWTQVEGYIMKHSDATFTHGVCPDCAKELYGDMMGERLKG